MPEFNVSIVITTFNRCQLVGRAIESALDQQWPGLEVLVVDDCSTDTTGEVVGRFSTVRYACQEKNLGICAARNRGLREASQPWVIFLDDDDRFLPGAIPRIAQRIAERPQVGHYPLCQFPRDNARVPSEFMVATLADFINGKIDGDFAHLICRERFFAEGLSFPEDIRAGAEHLLVWRLAENYGIPTWPDRVQVMSSDAPNRMMSTRFHLQFAREHAELHERTLQMFGDVLSSSFPAHYRKEQLAAAAYWILDGQPSRARRHVRQALHQHLSAGTVALGMLSFFPRVCAEKCFSLYRRRVTKWRD